MHDAAGRSDMRPLSNRRLSHAELTAAVVVVVFFCCLLIANRVLWGRDGEAHHQQLIREFRSIQPLPTALAVETSNHFSPWWPHKALVGTNYNAAAQYSEIREYYDQELISKGWRLAGEEPYTVWGKDSGGRVRDYCKGPLEAELQYAGSQPGWKYSLSLSWGLSQKCESGK